MQKGVWAAESGPYSGRRRGGGSAVLLGLALRAGDVVSGLGLEEGPDGAGVGESVGGVEEGRRGRRLGLPWRLHQGELGAAGLLGGLLLLHELHAARVVDEGELQEGPKDERQTDADPHYNPEPLGPRATAARPGRGRRCEPSTALV